MSRVGFEVLETTYANTILFPLAASWRLLRRRGPGKNHADTQRWGKSMEWVDGIFRICLTLEAHLVARGVRLPFGLSAICIARKKL